MCKILIVSSGQVSANPRLIKEAIAFVEFGYKLTVVYCPMSPWADNFDQVLFKKYPQINWIRAGYHPVNQKSRYFYSLVRRKIYRCIYRLLGNWNDAAIKSIVLFSQELRYEAYKELADIYIGHNLGALSAVIHAAKKNRGKSGFDFEDFHRGEDLEGSVHWNSVNDVESKYLPQLNFGTTASPLIEKQYRQLFPNLQLTTINNCFYFNKVNVGLSNIPKMPLKLFWFSQFVGKNRGLETVIKSIGLLKSKNIQLSLLGNCSASMKKYFSSIGEKNGLTFDQIVFIDPVSESEILNIAQQHHVGLAVEVSHNLNRNICLTNKVFLYLVAGNALIFTDTSAQVKFFEENPGIGSLFQQHNSRELADILSLYLSNHELLNSHRLESYRLGTFKWNWDIEKLNLIKNIKEVLSIN